MQHDGGSRRCLVACRLPTKLAGHFCGKPGPEGFATIANPTAFGSRRGNENRSTSCCMGCMSHRMERACCLWPFHYRITCQNHDATNDDLTHRYFQVMVWLIIS